MAWSLFPLLACVHMHAAISPIRPIIIMLPTLVVFCAAYTGPSWRNAAKKYDDVRALFPIMQQDKLRKSRVDVTDTSSTISSWLAEDTAREEQLKIAAHTSARRIRLVDASFAAAGAGASVAVLVAARRSATASSNRRDLARLESSLGTSPV